ncbi:MAG: PAAR domain-containing protein [Candidatus Contendobacter sp.]
MAGKPAARVTDSVVHPLPPVLTPGPGSLTVLIGFLPAWRGVMAAAAAALQAAKQVSDAAIKTAEAATLAAAGTPGLPAAKAAEETVKASAAASMGSMITSAAAGADIHLCATPLPIPPHGPGVVIDGSQTVLINNLPACRMGDTILEAVGPPNKIVKGEMTVLIGG